MTVKSKSFNDFGHAYVTNPKDNIDKFVTKFINGYNGWNPSFK